MPSVAESAQALREGRTTSRPAGLPGLVSRAVSLGAEVLRALGRHHASYVGCWSNDRLDRLCRLEQRVHDAEQALAAHIRLDSREAEVEALRVELAIFRAQIDELYVGPCVDAAISDVRNWEGSV